MTTTRTPLWPCPNCTKEYNCRPLSLARISLMYNVMHSLQKSNNNAKNTQEKTATHAQEPHTRAVLCGTAEYNAQNYNPSDSSAKKLSETWATTSQKQVVQTRWLITGQASLADHETLQKQWQLGTALTELNAIKFTKMRLLTNNGHIMKIRNIKVAANITSSCTIQPWDCLEATDFNTA